MAYGTLPELVLVVIDGPTHLHAQTDEEASSPRLSIYSGSFMSEKNQQNLSHRSLSAQKVVAPGTALLMFPQQHEQVRLHRRKRQVGGALEKRKAVAGLGAARRYQSTSRVKKNLFHSLHSPPFSLASQLSVQIHSLDRRRTLTQKFCSATEICDYSSHSLIRVS